MLFRSARHTPRRAQARVNLFSVIFTLSGLCVTMEILAVVEFMRADPTVVVHIAIMSICNAVGQSFIYYTIKTFGPLVFVTITTIRQLISIAVSFVLFSHPISSGQLLGITTVFSTVALSIRRKVVEKRAKEAAEAAEAAAAAVAPAKEPPQLNAIQKVMHGASPPTGSSPTMGMRGLSMGALAATHQGMN